MSSSSAPVPPVPEVAPVTTPASLSDAPVYDVPVHKDRGTGLVIFGVFQIILGLLAALMVPLIALGAFVSRLGPAGAMRPAQFLSGVATYGSIAAAMLALGIGSVQMKRWARALTLVTSWYWLITGVLITILLTAVLPVTMKSALAQINKSTPNAPSPAMSTGIMAVILTLIIIFAAFFLIVVPIAFVIFYGRKDVGETCRHRDPVERWTDRTPLPVLGASVILFIGALYLFMVAVTTPLFPFFGRYLTGPAGSAGFVLFAALDAYLAVGLFRLRSLAWWIAVCATPIRIFSVALTYAHADLMQAYSKIGFSDAQVQMIGSNPMLRGHVLLWWGLLSQMLFFGFVLWLKRYFKPDAPAPAEVLSAQVG
ncbi:MAG: hypothetical protein DMG79_19965 [Acidobacteria bacterium]|nr:MAG: hypothetical protein DMG79_19965 [Acidobacteriota bacterium]